MKTRDHMKKVLILLAVLSLGVILCWQCKNSNDQKFRIGFNTWIGYAPLYIAQEKGFFKEEGLNVELLRLEQTGERRAAMIAGRLEGLGSTIDDFVIGISQDLKGEMVLVADESNGGDGIVVKDNIKSISDFKGKRIGVQPGFVNHFFLLYLLDKYNIRPNEIKLVPLDPDKAAAALLTGDVDVAITWEPHLSEIKSQEGYKVLLTSKDTIAKHLIVDNIVIREDVIQNRPGDVKKLVKCWFRAVAYMQDHKDEAYKIISKEFSVQPSQAKDMLAGIYFPSINENKQLYNKNSNVNVYEIAKKAKDLYKEADIIKTNTNLNTLDQQLTSTFINEDK